MAHRDPPPSSLIRRLVSARARHDVALETGHATSLGRSVLGSWCRLRDSNSSAISGLLLRPSLLRSPSRAGA
jgi:hypothetical protein